MDKHDKKGLGSQSNLKDRKGDLGKDKSHIGKNASTKGKC